ncbi:MAG: hypothetical protein FJ311_11045 [Rhodospirillales bacterium]|nr:hypothetical protein [Rhodospirillales bacterium]
MKRRLFTIAAITFAGLALAACGNVVNPPARYGMVKDPDTGLQFGSVIEKNIVTDPSFHKNRQIKVRVRNTSGDVAFNLKRFTDQIRSAYRETGYIPTDGDDFGMMVDVNVVYSGHIQKNYADEFSFLGASAGAAAGGIAGYRSNTTAGTAIGLAAGTFAGATIGSIIGSYVTDDTYIIIARVTFGIIRGPRPRDGKSITFSRSITGHPEDEEEREEKRQERGIRDSASTRIAVFAGGRNVRQSEIAEEVRQRFVRIIGDVI